jgi:hypothetical protein
MIRPDPIVFHNTRPKILNWLEGNRSPRTEVLAEQTFWLDKVFEWTRILVAMPGQIVKMLIQANSDRLLETDYFSDSNCGISQVGWA